MKNVLNLSESEYKEFRKMVDENDKGGPAWSPVIIKRYGLQEYTEYQVRVWPEGIRELQGIPRTEAIENG